MFSRESYHIDTTKTALEPLFLQFLFTISRNAVMCHLKLRTKMQTSVDMIWHLEYSLEEQWISEVLALRPTAAKIPG